MSDPKQVLHWACRELEGDWVMIGVDANLSGPGECKTLGYRVALYRYCSVSQLQITIRHMTAVMLASSSMLPHQTAFEIVRKPSALTVDAGAIQE